MRKLLFIPLAMILISGCKRKIHPEMAFGPVPKISINNVEPTTVKEFDENVIVFLSYEDGDGDLGFEHPDSNALRIWDDRLERPDYYFVQPLSPLGEEISVRGTLEIRLNGTYVLGTGSEESTRFTISIKDRSGNWSNEVSTPVITIKK